MRKALAASSLSRAEVVDAMNDLALDEGLTTNGRAQRITESLLDKWVAPGAHTYMIPAKLLPIFCHGTHRMSP